MPSSDGSPKASASSASFGEGEAARAPNFRQLVEHMPQLIWTCDALGACNYLSQRWFEYTGIPVETQLGYGWLERVHPDDREALLAGWQEAQRAKHGAEFRSEIRLQRRDGVYRWFETRGLALRDANGAIAQWLGSNTDVTERREATDALRNSDERLQTVLQNLNEGLIVADLTGRLLHWNRAALEMHGFSSLADVLRHVSDFQKIYRFTTLEGQALRYEDWPVPRLLRGEELRDLELCLQRLDLGWERIFRYNGTLVREREGRLAFLTIADVTARALAREALVQGEARLRLANEVAGIGTYEVNFETGATNLSPEMRQLLDLPPRGMPSLQQGFAHVHPEDAQALLAKLRAGADPHGGGVARAEFRLTPPGREQRLVSWSSRTMFRDTPEGRVPVRAVGACLDVTEPRRAERRLATQYAVSQVLATTSTLREAAPKVLQAICESEGWDFGAFWELEESGAALRCAGIWQRTQPMAAELGELTRSARFAPNEGLPGRVWASAQSVLLKDVGGDPSYRRAALAQAAGLGSAVGFPIMLGGRVTGVLDFLSRALHGTDERLLEMFSAIGQQLGLFLERKRAEAERQRLETQLRQAQKMEALGRLSGGIAHDFNNILAAIIGNVHLARTDLGASSPALGSLEEIAKASERARDLVQQILTFARQKPQTRRALSLRDVVEESHRLLRAMVPAGVELTLQCADAPVVLADTTQLQQVIVNLVTNGWQALAGEPGTIAIRLATVELDEQRASRLGTRAAGRHALLSIADSGSGIDGATLERIFEPFFTTKDLGQGTGLGLSVVHGIVQSHDGAIAVSSEPGRGSTFDVYLPCAERPVSSERVPIAIEPRGAGQCVLYLDDEPALVVLARRLLSRLGYEVVGFTRANDALAAFRAEPQRFALVVTDFNMPGVSGLYVAEQLLAIRPELPVVLSSGHVSEELKAQAQALGVRHILHKPTPVHELGALLHSLLPDNRS